MELEKAEGGLTRAYQHLKGGWQEDGAGLLPVVPSDRTGGNGHKLQHGKFQLNVRKKLFTWRVAEPWHRLPREAVESPSLETFKPTWTRCCAACSG